MRGLSITKATAISVLIIAAAVALAQPQPYSGISYGWHISGVGFYHLQIFASVVTVVSAFIFSVSVAKFRIWSSCRSHMPMVAYTAFAAAAAGSSDFPAISLANLFLCVSFSFTSGHYGPDPMGGRIFKLMLLLFLISVPYPMMLWMVFPTAMMVAIAHSSTLKDLLSLVLSFAVLSAFSVWAIWVVGADPWDEIKAVVDFPSIESHVFSLFSDYILVDAVAVVMLLSVTVSWMGLRSTMAMMDVQSYKLEMFGIWGTVLLSALLFIIGAGHCFLAFYALPFPMILMMQMCSASSPKKRGFLLFLFFVAAVAVFIVANGLHLIIMERYFVR